MIMPAVTFDVTDAAELAELLQFLRDWFATDHGPLQASVRAFVGSAGYDLDQLATDLDRFTFLLGGSEGEPLFQPRPR